MWFPPNTIEPLETCVSNMHACSVIGAMLTCGRPDSFVSEVTPREMQTAIESHERASPKLRKYSLLNAWPVPNAESLVPQMMCLVYQRQVLCHDCELRAWNTEFPRRHSTRQLFSSCVYLHMLRIQKRSRPPSGVEGRLTS